MFKNKRIIKYIELDFNSNINKYDKVIIIFLNKNSKI